MGLALASVISVPLMQSEFAAVQRLMVQERKWIGSARVILYGLHVTAGLYSPVTGAHCMVAAQAV